MKTVTIFLLLHICFLPKMLWAQEEEKDNWWIGHADGIGTFHDEDHQLKMATYTGIYFQPKNAYFGLNAGVQIPVGSSSQATKSSLFEFDGIVGIGTRDKKYYANIGTGFSVIRTKTNKVDAMQGSTVFTSETSVGFGLPLQTELGININRNFSIGLQVLDNLNAVQPYSSYLLSLRFGRM